jgi:lysozyme
VNLISQLRREEGVSRHAYQDHLGFWTIGVGRLIDQRKGGGLSDEEVDHLLRNDIERFTREVEQALPWFKELNEPRQAVLIGMAFQMGTAGLLGFRNTLNAVRDNRWFDAAEGMLASRWAQQTPGRASRMAKQMETGQWQA